MIYAKILVKGNVQHVSYRNFVREIAKAMGVAGVVRHCYGDVEIEVEAKSEAELDEFVKLIMKKKDDRSDIDVKSAAVVSKVQSDNQKYIRFSVE
ncbi:MAG: acylphosphatase [Candidatus Micrarchaeota archaeon]